MGNRRGPKPQSRVQIDRKRFDEVLKYRGYTITSLAKKIKVSKDALYKQRDNPSGISEKLLDEIAEKLDIDIDFLKGRYNFFTMTCKPEYRDNIMSVLLEEGKFPYNEESKSDIARAEIDYRQYYQTIIPAHGIPFERFQSIPFKERLMFQKKLEYAISEVFNNWFGGNNPDRYDYLSDIDFNNIEEIYDWSGLDYIDDPKFVKKVHRFWEKLDEMEKEQPVPNDDALVEESIYNMATGERETRTVRYGDIDKELKRKHQTKPELVSDENE